MWHHVLTFGAEGTEAGNFCRPWGVTIARYSDLPSLSDSWSQIERDFNATSASSADYSADWPPEPACGNLGYNKRKLINPTIGSSANNNNSIGNSVHASAWSTYLIGIADRSNNRIQLFKFDAIRQTVTFLHMFGDGPGARHGQFDRPAGLVFNPKLEQIIVADKDNHRIQVFDISGSYLFKFGERGSKCGQFCYPWDIDVCKTSHNLIVSDTRNRRVQMFNNLGRYITHFNQPLDSPRGVVYLNSLQFIISDFNKHRLVMVTHIDDKTVTSSTPAHSMTNKLEIEYLNNNNQLPRSAHFGTMNQKSLIRPLTHQPLHESKFIGFGEGSSWGEFLRPQGLAANGSMVFCSDSRNNRVACWNKETQAFSYINKDTVRLDRPAGLATIDNYIVIVDFGNNRVFICQRK